MSQLFTKDEKNLYANDIAIEFGRWLCNRKVRLTNEGMGGEPEGYLEGKDFFGGFSIKSLFCHFIRETRGNSNYSFQDWANHEAK